MSQNDGSPGGLRRDTPPARLARPPLSLGGFQRGGTDFAEHDRILAELASPAIEARRVPDPGLAKVLNVAEAMPLRLGDFASDESLLADARRCIAGGEHMIALSMLDEYLRTSPAHQEARFLRALCLYRLGDSRYEEALRVLRPLRDEPTPKELRDRVHELRRELRRLFVPGEYAAYAATAKRDPGTALSRLGAVLELLPEEGKLVKLLALGYARRGEIERALEVAERGSAEADTERGQLEQLARGLRLMLLRKIAAPAAGAYKTGDPYRARTMLARLEPRWRDSGPIRDFDRYLALVIEHDNPRVPPKPMLPDDRAEDLYSLIAETDLQRALDLLTRGDMDQAERLLGLLVDKLPGFAVLNFIYAFCLYELGRNPARAEACAAAALRDPSLGQARSLLSAIHAWQEAIAINPVVEEFIAITDTLRNSVTPEQLPALRGRLAEVERRIPALRKAVRTADGRAAVAELAAAIVSWRAELDRANLTVQVVDLVRRFNEIGAVYSSARRPEEWAGSLLKLQAIDQEARRLRDRIGRSLDPRDLEQLNTIITTIGRLWQ